MLVVALAAIVVSVVGLRQLLAPDQPTFADAVRTGLTLFVVFSAGEHVDYLGLLAVDEFQQATAVDGYDHDQFRCVSATAWRSCSRVGVPADPSSVR